MKEIDDFVDGLFKSSDRLLYIKKEFDKLKEFLISSFVEFFKEFDSRFLRTIETIKKELYRSYESIDKKVLKKRLSYINFRGREHLKQVKKMEKQKLNPTKKYRYILSPAAETHCKVCVSHSNILYSYSEALNIKKSLPYHVGCTCYLKEE